MILSGGGRGNEIVFTDYDIAHLAVDTVLHLIMGIISHMCDKRKPG